MEDVKVLVAALASGLHREEGISFDPACRLIAMNTAENRCLNMKSRVLHQVRGTDAVVESRWKHAAEYRGIVDHLGWGRCPLRTQDLAVEQDDREDPVSVAKRPHNLEEDNARASVFL